jgi:hypothetical protein
VDHIIAESRGGPTDLTNFALCCYGCQLRKLAFETGVDPATEQHAKLFHPRRQRWGRHFRWSSDGLFLEGLTRVGRATIERLALNNERQIEARRRWRLHRDLFP